MYLDDILYKITDEQITQLGIKNRGDLFINFKKHLTNIITNLNELNYMFDDDFNSFKFDTIDSFVNYVYEQNHINTLYSIMPKVKTNMNDMILYHQLYLTSSESYIDLMFSNGCSITQHTPDNFYINDFKILGTGTFGTGLLLPNGKVLKITSDVGETYKDKCIIYARNKNLFKKALDHLPEIYELGQLEEDFTYILPTNGKVLNAPNYSIKKYYDGNQKVSNSELNNIINDNDTYYKEFQNELEQFGNMYGINWDNWDIHSDNVCLTNTENRFVYFDY